MYPELKFFCKPTGQGFDRWRGVKFVYKGELYGNFFYDRSDEEITKLTYQFIDTLNGV